MNYSKAVSKGINNESQGQSIRKNGSVPGNGHTKLYPSLPTKEEDFPPLSGNHGPNNATTAAANKPAFNHSSTSNHAPKPGQLQEVGEIAGKDGDGMSGFNQGSAVHSTHNSDKQNSSQHSTEQGNTGVQNISEKLANKSQSQDSGKKHVKNDFDFGPSDAAQKIVDQNQINAQNVSSQQGSMVERNNSSMSNRQDGNPLQDQDKNNHQNSLCSSRSRVDWKSREPRARQAGKPSAGLKGDETPGHNNTSNHGNQSQGSRVAEKGREPHQTGNSSTVHEGNNTSGQGNTSNHGNQSQGSRSKVAWRGREPQQAGKPFTDHEGNNAPGQGNTSNHGNKSQGSRSRGEPTKSQGNTVEQNVHHQDKPQSFGNTQQGNSVNEYRQEKGHSQQKKRHHFDDNGARPRDNHHYQHGGNKGYRYEEVEEYWKEEYQVDPEIIEKFKDDKRSKFKYFWQSHDVYSQWHKSDFKVDGETYMCAEQFMMHRKAMLFEDFGTARKIMETRDPRKQKKLGRQVDNFDEGLWQDCCDDIVLEGNMAKFSQNSELLNIIFSSNPRILVEASPMDKIWGIGLYSDDPRAWNRAYWLGENKLGKALTKVRNKLMLDRGLITKEDYDRQIQDLMR